jgi:hypothetical protein
MHAMHTQHALQQKKCPCLLSDFTKF